MRKSLFIICMAILALSPLSAKDVFTALFSEVDVDFNPHKTFTSTEAQLYTAVFEGLVTYHPRTLEPLPAAAESWDVSEDGLTYTFKLRRNLKYSNGDPIVASHFRDSWLDLMSPRSGSDYGSLLDMVKNGESYRKGTAPESAVGISVPTDRILKIELEQPAPHFLKVLCHHSFAPKHPAFGQHSGASLIVNGPYRIDETGERGISFVKNEYYWDRDNVSIGALKINFSDDPVENSWDFNRDEIDWLTDRFDLSIINVDEAVIFNPLFSTSYLFFSNKTEEWSNGEIRRAMALLLPWEEIRSTQMMPGSTLIPSIPNYPAVKGIEEEDIEEALKILEQQGYAGGKGLPPVTLRLPRSEVMLRIGDIISRSWKTHLDLNVDIISENYPHYFNSLKGDDYTIGALTWIGDYADPMTFLEMWLMSSSLNDASFRNREYDEKVLKSSGADLEERYRLMSEAETILLDSAQVMPLGHSPALNIIDLRFIDGWYPNVLDIHPFKYLKFKMGYQIPGVV